MLAGLAASAEEHGWDGFFVWDHVRYRRPVQAVADPWVALAAVASATERIRLGPLVTPLSRRRIHKLARETVTLDLLSRGRLTLGVGLGSDRNDELEPFGEVVDPRERARLLDAGLDRLSAYWGGEFEPRPVAIATDPGLGGRPVAQPPADPPSGTLGRALPDRAARIPRRSRSSGGRFMRSGARRNGTARSTSSSTFLSGSEVGPWEKAGATWILADFGLEPREREVRETIESGPR